jgi:stalled ribosome rescue protein Dom34
MSAYVVWIDSHEAKLFDLNGKKQEPKHFHTHGAKHPAQPHGKHAGAHHPESEHLFADVSQTLQKASQILVIGPGEAKTHFKSYLEKHFASSLGKKIVGVETVDHPTDNQIVALAGRFFKIFDLYNG